MRHINKGGIAVMLLAACMAITVGCKGAERGQQEASEAFQTAERVCYYQTRQIETPVHAQGFSGWITGSNMTENGLYYLMAPLDGPDKEPKLYRVSMEKLYHEDVLSGNYAAVQPVQITDELPLPENMTEMKNEWFAIEYCERFFQGENGELYYLTFNSESGKRWLYRVDAQGRELSAADVTEALQDMPYVEELTEGYLENSSCAADSQGRVCLTDSQQTQLWILDPQGKLHIQMPLPQDTGHVAYWQGGKVYLVAGQDAASQIIRLDGESGDMETVMDMPQTVGRGTLVPMHDGEQSGRLFYRDQSGLYVCDSGQGSAECLVNWNEAGISGKNILQARETGAGKIYIWEDDYCLTQVSFVPTTELPAQKQRVTVAVTGSHELLDMMIADFNRHNAYYEAEIVHYNYFEGRQKLETELATGKAPDLLDTQLLYMDMLVEKGLLADIGSYLEDGRGIERQDLVEAVLRCNTIDGVLTCIPRSFGLEVLVGKTQLLGDEPGWTLEEYMSCIQENAGLEVMGSNRFSHDSNQSAHAILELPMYGDISHWADYRQGEARFEREDFLALLELAGSYEVTQPAVNLMEMEELQAGRMLTYLTAVYKMKDYLRMNAVLQQDIVYKGYPAEDGIPVYSLAGREGFAINARSRVQDGAWALMEYLLTYQFSEQPADGTPKLLTEEYFSVLESQFDYQMTQSMVKEYQKNSNFDLVYDQEGNPIETTKYTWYDMNGNVTAECLAATPEDVESLRRLIDMASQPSDTLSNSLFQILYEETSAYLEDQRSAQETAAIIQSRVQLFLDENK